jgi:Icc protein
LLGLTSVHYVEHNHTLAITDIPLIEAAAVTGGQ